MLQARIYIILQAKILQAKILQAKIHNTTNITVGGW